MKVAVSIPDPIFADAERLAKRWQTTRSDVYARALIAFVGTHSPDLVTEAMNETVDGIDQSEDRFLREAARHVLARVEW